MKSLSDYSANFKVGVAIGVCGEVLSGIVIAVYGVQVGLELVDRYQRDQPTDHLECPAAGFQSFMNSCQLIMLIVTIVLFVLRVERRRGLSRILVARCSIGIIGFAVGGILSILLGSCFLNQATWGKIIGCVGYGFTIISAFLLVLAPEMRQTRKGGEAARWNPHALVYANT
ncbi:hypothetical protein Pmar_PMAR002872 [Perkinsus marinus ATCC 50983]|uniref:Uncharacterized protein n=1 Tax=Perkinsus marinus (strain ATCC 50983 / TXsc) TaxID=423536 RepID=C5LQS0_PERM5|nr:hypothetical protein Pmar_PMAR002872 [Perkinsus marinus ATCC 50983]EER00805.1 hypothetical protein Pmar_PMAR002872 [Perkinsus marinus ATCC 50983]|eukprot:XP_002768087.1 hypothetical protein Pmar_PMAR002872 [Perkinsus marinus ATCC 50983]